MSPPRLPEGEDRRAQPASVSSSADISLAAACACTLGEGALWCERTQRLLYTDIEGRRVHAYTPSDGTLRTWPAPDRVGSFALTTASETTLLLALAKGVALFDLARGEIVGAVAPIEPDEPRTRLNDGRTDAQGRFVVGTYNQSRDEAPIGHWYRVDGRRGGLDIERLPLPQVGVANACAFSPDGARMYFTDSPTRTIWRADYPADGVPGKPEVFARIADGDGFPDGACVDADGGLWVALWDGAAVRRYAADGRITDDVALPARRPTCPAFGGPALDSLYVTSARVGLAVAADDSSAAAQAQGALWAVSPLRLGRRHGLPERRFAVGGAR